MNKIFLLMIFMVLCNTINSYSASTQYRSLEVDDEGDLTGNAVIYELEWLNSDTLKITVSSTPSSQSDNVLFFNLTSYTRIDSIITCGHNTKYIPFDGSGSYIATSCNQNCYCRGGFIAAGCAYEATMPGEHCYVFDDEECSKPNGCYAYSKVYNGGSTSWEGYGGGILVNANHIVFENE